MNWAVTFNVLGTLAICGILVTLFAAIRAYDDGDSPLPILAVGIALGVASAFAFGAAA